MVVFVKAHRYNLFMSDKTGQTVDPEALCTAAKLILSTGAKIVVPQPDQQWSISLTPEDLIVWATDKNQFYARFNGVTVEQWASWLKFLSTPRCSALTRVGQFCKNEIHQGEYPDSPVEFIFGIHDRCRIHKPATLGAAAG